MNEKELIDWFWSKFNSCYLAIHDKSIFMFNNPQYARKLKLANISGEKINKTDIARLCSFEIDKMGICLFEQDWKNKIFYYNFDEIWHYLYSNYSNDCDKIQQFISDRLKEYPNLSVLTPLRCASWYMRLE